MAFQNCPKCGKVFHYVYSPICDECKKEEEETFERVRAYIKEHPGSNISKIAHDTEVKEKKILNYVREGRLELSSEAGAGVQCEKCGKEIRTGRFCNDCVKDINLKVLTKLDDERKQKEAASKGAKMFTDRRER